MSAMSDSDSSSSEEDEELEQLSSEEEEGEQDSKEREASHSHEIKPTLQLTGGFRWDVGVAKTDTAAIDGHDAETSSESEEDDEQDESEVRAEWMESTPVACSGDDNYYILCV